MKFSDVIVPFIIHNDKAVNMLVQTLRIKMHINKRQQLDHKLQMRPRSFSDHFDEVEALIKSQAEQTQFTETLPFSIHS